MAAAPQGRWTGIRWIDAGAVFPQAPAPQPGKGSFVGVSVFGWSRGYVGFRAAVEQLDDATSLGEVRTYTSLPAPVNVEMVSTASSDGVHWSPGRPFPLPSGAAGAVEVREILEGPAGLLAAGSAPRGACGGPLTIDVLWFSPDGVSWSLVEPPSGFTDIATVDGGPSGFVAVASSYAAGGPAVWVSPDGRSWHRGTAPGRAATVDGGLAVAGGYLVSGASRIEQGCGLAEYVPSVWWSADARSWARELLPSAKPTDVATVTLTRISGHEVMAVASESNAATHSETQEIWGSADGRTWRAVKSPSPLLDEPILTNGDRGLVFATPDTTGAATVATVQDDLSVTTLRQTGHVPVWDPGVALPWLPAFGPTGLVVLSADGRELWLGVPVAG